PQTEEWVEGDPGDEPGEPDRQHEDERDRVAAEEARARQAEGGKRPQRERDDGCEEPGAEREPERVPHLLVVPRLVEPLRREAWDWPALDVRGVERVE